jgi:hypothetical protein
MARTTFQVSVDLLCNSPVGFENRSIVAVLKTVRQMQICLKWSVPPENASPSDIKCVTVFTASYKFLFCSHKELPRFSFVFSAPLPA